MNVKLHDFLSKKSTKELLDFEKNLLRPLLKKNKNEGYRYFQTVLKAVNSDYTKFEHALKILDIPKGQTPKKKDNENEERKDLSRAIFKYEQGYDDQKDGDRFDYGRSKVKKYVIETLERIIEHVGYEVNYESEIIIRGSRARKRVDNELYFKCYYWFENEERKIRTVKTGLLHFNCINPKGTDYKLQMGNMDIYSSNSASDGSAKLIAKNEDIINEHGLVYSFFRNDEDEKIITELTFNVGRDLPTDWKFITATYSTIGPGRKVNPIVGLMILQRIDSQDDFIKTKEVVDPTIHHFLHRTRTFAIPPVFEEISALPSAREVDLLNKYVGHYSGTYFSRVKGSSKRNEDQIINFLFTIEANGEATMDQPDLDEPYQGRVRILTEKKNDALIGYFDFMIKERTYRFTIYFAKKFFGSQKDLLYAIYAGIEREDPYVPTAGRMIFKKIKDFNDEDKAQYITNTRPIEKFISLPENVEVVSYLKGEVEEADYFEQLSSITPVVHTSEPKQYAGTYYTYYLSTLQAKIYKVPVKIFPDGRVIMKTRDFSSSKFHKGAAIYNGSERLSLYIENIMHEKGSYFHLLFSVGNMSVVEPRDHFFGVSSKMDTWGSPAARLEVLLREDFDFDKTHSKTFKIGSWEYKTEDDDYDGILSYLTGRDNRIVVSKKTVNAEFARSNDHYHYFYAACYLSERVSNDEDIEKAVQLLYQAYLHGFGYQKEEIEILDREMNQAFKAISNSKIKSKPDVSRLTELPFKAIISKIKARYKK